MKSRVYIFIDGSNFYHRLADLTGQSRLGNYFRFFKGLVNHYQQLAGVTYYIGEINPRTGKTPEERLKSRALHDKQDCFLKHLTLCGLEYKLGYFQRDGETEKGVDVKIAVDMIRYAYEDRYDIAFLVSGDGDLVDAVKLVREIGKKVCNVIFLKGKRFSYRLRNACGQYFFIDRQVEEFIRGK